MKMPGQAGARARHRSPNEGAAGRTRDRETELKFGFPEAAGAALMEAIGAGAGGIRLNSIYFDTPDGRLAAAGISVRLREQDGRWRQTVKAGEGDAIQDRLEHEAEAAGPQLDLARHDGSPAGAQLRTALAQLAGAPLVERSRSEVERLRCELAEDGCRVEVGLDRGRLFADGREEAIAELEFELKDGDAAGLCELAGRWTRRYGLWLAATSKAARGERLLAGGAPPAVRATPPRLAEGMSGEAMLRAIVRSCTDQIVANAGAVAAGSRDADHVHQLRVGLRRLRTAMRELGDLSECLDPAWEAPLAELFRRLGDYRDRQAVLAAIEPALHAAGAAGIAWMAGAETAVDPVEAVREPDFQSALVALLGFALGDGQKDRPASAADLARRLRRRLKSLHRRVVDDGHHFARLAEPAQHRVRKRLKRLRYLSEFVAPLFGKRAVESYLDLLRPAQDALGKHNDYAVARQLAESAAARGDADADWARRWLAGELKGTAKAGRKRLRELEEAPRFWKRKAALH